MDELFAGADGPEAETGAEGTDVICDDAGWDMWWLSGEKAKEFVVGGVHDWGGRIVVRGLLSVLRQELGEL